jgi:hypothetical protein
MKEIKLDKKREQELQILIQAKKENKIEYPPKEQETSFIQKAPKVIEV